METPILEGLFLLEYCSALGSHFSASAFCMDQIQTAIQTWTIPPGDLPTSSLLCGSQIFTTAVQEVYEPGRKPIAHEPSHL